MSHKRSIPRNPLISSLVRTSYFRYALQGWVEGDEEYLTWVVWTNFGVGQTLSRKLARSSTTKPPKLRCGAKLGATMQDGWMELHPVSEQEASAGLVNLAPQIDALHDRTLTAAPPAQTGSALALDDLATDPLQMSQVVWHTLSHSAGDLFAFRSLTIGGDHPHYSVQTFPTNLYPSLRAAFENACVAVWLLSPSSRKVRVERRLRLAVADAANAENLRSCIGKDAESRYGRRVEMVNRIAIQSGIPEGPWRKPSYLAMVQAAGEATLLGKVTAEMMWRVMSGMTHGDMWTLHAMSDLEEIPSSDEEIANYRVTAKVARIYTVATLVHAMTRRAFELYDAALVRSS